MSPSSAIGATFAVIAICIGIIGMATTANDLWLTGGLLVGLAGAVVIALRLQRVRW